MLPIWTETMAGVKTAPANWKYKYGDGHLYVVHSSQGLGKVGYTKDPRYRFSTLTYQFRQLGFEPDFVKVWDFERWAMGMENRSIVKLTKKFEVLKGREFFKCLSAVDFLECIDSAFQDRENYYARLRLERDKSASAARIRKIKKERPQIIIDRMVASLTLQTT